MCATAIQIKNMVHFHGFQESEKQTYRCRVTGKILTQSICGDEYYASIKNTSLMLEYYIKQMNYIKNTIQISDWFNKEFSEQHN